MNPYKRIRQSMRKNEVELLAYLRKNNIGTTTLFGMSWYRALDRLMAGGMVQFVRGRNRYRVGRYTVRKGAKPVTPAVRG